jgi:hypothetical protein
VFICCFVETMHCDERLEGNSLVGNSAEIGTDNHTDTTIRHIAGCITVYKH